MPARGAADRVGPDGVSPRAVRFSGPGDAGRPGAGAADFPATGCVAEAPRFFPERDVPDAARVDPPAWARPCALAAPVPRATFRDPC